MIFNTDIENDQWIVDGQVDYVSIDRKVFTVQDTMIGFDPLVKLKKWIIDPLWKPIGIMHDFKHGLFIKEQEGHLYATIGILNNDHWSFNNKFNKNSEIYEIIIDDPKLCIVTDNLLLIANNENWLKIDSLCNVSYGIGLYVDDKYAVTNDYVIVHNKAYLSACIRDNCIYYVLGNRFLTQGDNTQGDNKYPKRINGKINDIFYNNRDLFWVDGQQYLYIYGNKKIFFQEEDNIVTIIDSIDNVISIENDKFITPSLRIVMTGIYKGVADLVSNDWTAVPELSIGKCIAIKDSAYHIFTVNVIEDQLVFNEIAIKTGKVRQIYTWHINEQINDAFIVDLTTIMCVLTNGKVYTYTVGANQPIDNNDEADIFVDTHDNKPLLVRYAANNEDAYRVNDINISKKYITSRYAVKVQDKGILLGYYLLVNNDLKYPAKAQLDLKNMSSCICTYLPKDKNMFLVSTNKEITWITDVKISEENDKWYEVINNGLVYNVSGKLTAATYQNENLYIVIKIGDLFKLIIIKENRI